MVYQDKVETLPRDQLRQLQIERLQSTLNRAYRNVAFYRHMFDQEGIDIEGIKSLEALKDLPFTSREDLQNSYPYDMFAVPLREVVRIHSTSATTRKPVVAGYTRNDLRHWSEAVARLLRSAGISEHDVVQIALNYDLFAGGFGFHQGAEKLGASVIPSGFSSDLRRQVTVMKDYKSTVVICTPSYACRLASALEELKIHPEELQLRTGIFCVEPWTESLRVRLQQKLQVEAIDSYGLTELMGPGVAGECAVKDGLHVNEDYFIAEVIDPRTLEPLQPGQEGELVFTTITKEAFPLIRYRTGDISALEEKECECGRTFLRIRKVTRRTDDQIFFEGRRLFPSQIEQILLEAEGASPHYQIVLDMAEGSETMEVKVEVSEQIPSLDELKILERLRSSIQTKIQSDLGVQAKVTFVEPKSLHAGGETEISRVVDKRKL